jgi:YebC/PmpR family DNA-binding regulatory protein
MGRAHEVRAASMAKTAAIKSKHNAKYGTAIYKAAKSGVPDPELNQSLKKEIEKAKKAQVPANVIQRAIDKAKGGVNGNFEEVRYEGFGPNNSLIIVDTVTDNVNRTFTDIRTIFSKSNCKLGVVGSVTHMFNYSSVFSIENMTEDNALEILLLADCDVTDIESDEDIITIYAPATEYQKIKDAFLEQNPEFEFLEDEITFVPLSYVELVDEEDIKSIKKLQSMLDECDDVQQIYHNIEGLLEDAE